MLAKLIFVALAIFINESVAGVIKASVERGRGQHHRWRAAGNRNLVELSQDARREQRAADVIDPRTLEQHGAAIGCEVARKIIRGMEGESYCVAAFGRHHEDVVVAKSIGREGNV